mgnify:CR=1 FL=1
MRNIFNFLILASITTLLHSCTSSGENTGIEYELVSLRGKSISGCTACLGCVKDNICVVDDDLAFLVFFQSVDAADHCRFTRS